MGGLVHCTASSGTEDNNRCKTCCGCSLCDAGTEDAMGEDMWGVLTAGNTGVALLSCYTSVGHGGWAVGAS